MKILFLDIDGVLNSWQSTYMAIRNERHAQELLCPISLSNLDELMLSVGDDLKIVISSTWRNQHSYDNLKIILELNGSRFSDRVVGVTPSIVRKFSEEPNRYDECMSFLDTNKGKVITQWAIVDDHEVMSLYNHDQEYIDQHFVQTDSRVGFDWHILYKLNKLFGGKELGICLM